MRPRIDRQQGEAPREAVLNREPERVIVGCGAIIHLVDGREVGSRGGIQKVEKPALARIGQGGSGNENRRVRLIGGAQMERPVSQITGRYEPVTSNLAL